MLHTFRRSCTTFRYEPFCSTDTKLRDAKENCDAKDRLLRVQSLETPCPVHPLPGVSWCHVIDILNRSDSARLQSRSPYSYSYDWTMRCDGV